MRALPAAAGDLSGLTNDERLALQYVAQGLSPRAIAERVDLSEEHVYQLVARVLDELEPAPDGMTLDEVHARHGTRPATAEELAQFERSFGPSLSPDDEP